MAEIMKLIHGASMGDPPHGSAEQPWAPECRYSLHASLDVLLQGMRGHGLRSGPVIQRIRMYELDDAIYRYEVPA